jgi:hypothetical protein
MAALARALAPASVADDAHLEDLAAELEVRAAAEKEKGLDEDELDRRTDRACEMAQAMMAVRANSLAGLQTKARAVVGWAAAGDGDAFREMAPKGTPERFANDIVSDLLALPTATVHPFPQAVPAAPEAMSPLLRAAAEFAACRADHDEAWSRLSAAMDAAEKLAPEPPQIIRDWQRPGFALGRLKLANMDAAAVALTWPKPEGSPRVEAYDRWRAQVEAIESSFGIPGLDEVSTRANHATDNAAERVAAMRPETIQEAVVKYAVLLASWGNEKSREIDGGELFFAFLSDLEHVAQASR